MPQYSEQDIWNLRALDTALTTSQGPNGEISKGRRYYKAKNVLSNALLYGNYGRNGNYGDSQITKCAIYFVYQYVDHYAHFLLYTNGNIKYLSSKENRIMNNDVNLQPKIIGNVYDNQNLLIPCDSFGWLTMSELTKLNSEKDTGNITQNDKNKNTFEQIALVSYSQNLEYMQMKVPGDLPTPPVYTEQATNAVAYYQTRYDYSISGYIPGHKDYNYPKPTVPDPRFFESEDFFESYPYGAFSYSSYLNDKTLIKEKFDIKWYLKSSQTLAYAGEQYQNLNYTNTFVIKTDGNLYVNDQVWIGSDIDKGKIEIPFHATGLLWKKEFQGMLASNGGPNSGVFKALTGVDLSTYWTPTPGKNPPVNVCKTKTGIFKDRIYHSSPIYLYNQSSGQYNIQVDRTNLTPDQPLFFNMGNMFNELSVYSCVYYQDVSSLSLQKYVKIEVNGDVSNFNTTNTVKSSDYPSLKYSKVGNLFDPSSPWYVNKTYIALQFYGALYTEEQDYYRTNKECAQIFTELTYANITDIEKYKVINGNVVSTLPPPDDTPEPTNTNDQDTNPPPINTTDPDDIPKNTDNTNTNTDNNTDTNTDNDVKTDDTIKPVDPSAVAETIIKIEKEIKQEVEEPAKIDVESPVNTMDIDIGKRIIIGIGVLLAIGVIVYVSSKEHKKSSKKHKKHKHIADE